ncbi:MerR family transcriptional regulator [Lutibacter flavus]|uniref:B12 binding domain-containing protein n=1 Tax=Lutibacter flavus TaxID=691689 RepID=A0A238VTH8_9FLAO|nr:MerR family transcriptional regulator [Lutibacter flavus]SNR37548.1 B12 binding domain-containing protein [Lutibacter flavus]
MNNIKSEFTIKDLENFSGIKAHTIRIWEKRYNLLEPNRTESNIRYYNLQNLQKLLNVAFLNNNGLKISKIAELSESNIVIKVRELVTKTGINEQASNALKLSMLNFDENMFNETYNNLVVNSSFREIFKNVFIPFINEIGMLWQVNSITPAHEHFISNLIQQKIQINIERLQLSKPINLKKVFVLYLPMNEIHDLGLLYLHFEILLHGYQSVYLGQSVPVSNLNDVQNVFNSVCFISYLTVEPSQISVKEYIEKVKGEVLSSSNNELWLLGRKIQESTEILESSNVRTFNSVIDLIKYL